MQPLVCKWVAYQHVRGTCTSFVMKIKNFVLKFTGESKEPDWRWNGTSILHW